MKEKCLGKAFETSAGNLTQYSNIIHMFGGVLKDDSKRGEMQHL
jgi:hypothetical protein